MFAWHVLSFSGWLCLCFFFQFGCVYVKGHGGETGIMWGSSSRMGQRHAVTNTNAPLSGVLCACWCYRRTSRFTFKFKFNNYGTLSGSPGFFVVFNLLHCSLHTSRGVWWCAGSVAAVATTSTHYRAPCAVAHKDIWNDLARSFLRLAYGTFLLCASFAFI